MAKDNETLDQYCDRIFTESMIEVLTEWSRESNEYEHISFWK